MHAFNAYGNPEEVIAALNRRRQIKVVLVLSGLFVALASLFAATAAMYSDDPLAEHAPSAIQ